MWHKIVTFSACSSSLCFLGSKINNFRYKIWPLVKKLTSGYSKLWISIMGFHYKITIKIFANEYQIISFKRTWIDTKKFRTQVANSILFISIRQRINMLDNPQWWKTFLSSISIKAHLILVWFFFSSEDYCICLKHMKHKYFHFLQEQK